MPISIQKKTIDYIQKTLRRKGLKIARFPEPEKARRLKIMEFFKIKTVLDVGGNIGGYGKELRELGFSGKIISFEPTEEAFQLLQKKCTKDPNWHCHPFGLGDKNEVLPINVSLNSRSSSVLDVLPISIENSPDSMVKKVETIEIKTLDGIFSDLVHGKQGIMLKIDTQGYERQVLEGAKNSLNHIDLIQMEMSFEPLYRGESTFWELVPLINEFGFELFALESDLSFTNPESGKMLQVDGIFGRKVN